MARVLVIAHREELIYQAVGHAKAAGLTAGVEMGNLYSHGEQAVVATVQTLISRRRCRTCGGTGCPECENRGFKFRMERFSPWDFDAVICDEGHHATATTYRMVFNHFRKNETLKLLLVTATPQRSDGVGLWNVVDSCAYSMELKTAIDEGWLCPIRQSFVEVQGLDLSRVKSKGGDLADGELERQFLGETDAEQERLLHEVAKPAIEQAGGRPLLIFAAGVKHATELTAACNAYDGIHAECVLGGTDKDQRRRIIARYKSGETNVLVGCGVFCLDEKTEILTTDGWIGIDEISDTHKVANWDNGEVYFKEPRFIVKRDRLPGETMVSSSTRRSSIRVTGQHRMLYRTVKDGRFRIAHASTLSGRRFEVPVSGIAEPLDVTAEQPAEPSRKSYLASVRANSYALRKAGWAPELAKAEAECRLAKKLSLRRLDPTQLTEDQCRLIGFWIAEGTRTQLQSGGVEYSISQSEVYPGIVAWFDAVVERTGIDCRRRVDSKRGVVRWSFPRGTGFGPQARNGVFSIEPYLEKDGSPLLWGLNGEQFDALIEGLFWGDGNHGQLSEVPRSIRIDSINYGFCSLLQAIAVCRGYSSTVRPGGKSRKDNHNQIFRVSLRKASSLQVDFGSFACEPESDWKAERVWCVTTETGNIITRRDGYVTVTGNTEGFDAPATEFVAMARPTKSLSLYLQCIGRGTRPLPRTVDGLATAEERRAAIAASAKPHCVVLDFVGNAGSHKIVSVADCLAGSAVDPNDIAEAIAAAKKETEPVDMEELIEKAKAAREARQAAEEAARKRISTRNRADRCEYTAQDIDLFAGNPFDAIASYKPAPGGATASQVSFLVKLGVAPATAMKCSKNQAGAIITKLRSQTGGDYILTGGKHMGKKIKDVPSGYQNWLIESGAMGAAEHVRKYREGKQ